MKSKKSLTNLISELEVKNRRQKIPKDYKGYLCRVLSDVNSELEALSNRLEVTGAYTSHLQNCIADKITDPLLLNMLSGYEATFFYMALVTCGNDTGDIITIYDTLYSLTERDEIGLIYCFVKSKYIESDTYFPEFFDELRSNEDMFKDFMYELLADLEELVTEEFTISDIEMAGGS